MLLVSMVTGIEISPLTVNLNPPFVYFFDAYLEGEAGRHSVTTATQTSHLKEESPKRNLLPPPPDLLQLIVPPVSDRAGTTEGHVWGFLLLTWKILQRKHLQPNQLHVWQRHGSIAELLATSSPWLHIPPPTWGLCSWNLERLHTQQLLWHDELFWMNADAAEWLLWWTSIAFA